MLVHEKFAKRRLQASIPLCISVSHAIHFEGESERGKERERERERRLTLFPGATGDGEDLSPDGQTFLLSFYKIGSRI